LSIKWPKTAGGGRPPSNYWKNQYLDWANWEHIKYK
jgi:hypothetical protein